MRKFLVLTATAAALLLPRWASADEGPRPDRPSPEAFFRHLDTNNDGFLTREESPPPMQARFDDLLARADKNNDKKFDQAEFAALRKPMPPRDGERRPPVDRPWGMRGGPGPHDRSPGEADRGRPEDGSRMPGRPDWGRYAHDHKRPEGHRPGGMGPKGPGSDRARALFMRMDQDDDGRLTPREFIKGMEALHRATGPRAHGFADRSKMDGDKRPHGAWGDHGRWSGGPYAYHGPWSGHKRPGHEFFDRLDKDGDGKISKAEAPERLQQHFDKVDRDQDGNVTKDELKQAFMAMAQKRAEEWKDGDKKACDVKADATKCEEKKAEEKKTEKKK